MQALRAVYEQGRLRLLDPVNLTDGQEVQLMIVSDRERAYMAMQDLIATFEPEPEVDTPLDEAALFAEIDADTRGKPSISDAIIDERQEGP